MTSRLLAMIGAAGLLTATWGCAMTRGAAETEQPQPPAAGEAPAPGGPQTAEVPAVSGQPPAQPQPQAQPPAPGGPQTAEVPAVSGRPPAQLQPQAQPPAPGGPQTAEVPAVSGQPVTDDELERYARALVDMSRFDPDLAVVVERGDVVEMTLIDRGITRPEARQAIEQQGLSEQRFRQIAQQVAEDKSLQRRYRQAVQEVAPASGAAGQPPGTTGAPAEPGASPAPSPQ